MKRIGIIQVWQESNSFNPVSTRKADFEAFALGFGQEALVRFGTGEEVGGFLEALQAWPEKNEPVGLMVAQAWCGGPIDKQAKEFLAEAIRKQVGQAGKLDAVLF